MGLVCGFDNSFVKSILIGTTNMVKYTMKEMGVYSAKSGSHEMQGLRKQFRL